MRTLVAWSVGFGALVLIACASDYSSDDPTGDGNGDGGGTGSSGTPGEGGTSSSGTLGEGGTIPGKPITVTGKIVSYGVPLANIPVVVAGKTAVNTSSLGTFSVPDVTPPYDVAFAVKTNDAQARVSVYQGLTRPDPTLVGLGTTGELRPNATTATSLSGTVSGAGGPNWAKPPVVGFGGPNRAFGFVAAAQDTGSYSIQGAEAPVWYGTNAVTGSLYAALVLDNVAPITAFFGKVDNVTLTAGTATSGKDVTLEPVAVGLLEARAAAPARYNDPSKTMVNMGIRYPGEGAGYFVRLNNPGSFPINAKRAVPRVDGSKFQLSVGYTSGGAGELSFAKGTTAAQDTGEISVILPEPPTQNTPAEGATIGRTDTLTFNAFPGGIHRITLVGSANQPSVTIVTAGTSVALPDLAPFAVTLPSGVDYTWRVAGYRPITSLDANELPVFMAVIDGNFPNVESCEIGISPARKVTFAP